MSNKKHHDINESIENNTDAIEIEKIDENILSTDEEEKIYENVLSTDEEENNDKDITSINTTDFGEVTDCLKLNVRSCPSNTSEIVAVIPVKTTVLVDIFNSIEDWYKVYLVEGIEGFCMKKYIRLNS